MIFLLVLPPPPPNLGAEFLNKHFGALVFHDALLVAWDTDRLRQQTEYGAAGCKGPQALSQFAMTMVISMCGMMWKRLGNTVGLEKTLCLQPVM